MKTILKIMFLFCMITALISKAQEWQVLNSPTTQNLWGVFFQNKDQGFICGDSGKIFKTTNGGLNWTALNTGTKYALAGLQFFNSIGYASSWMDAGGKLLKTNNGGSSWSDISLNITNAHLGDGWFFSQDTGLVAIGDNAYSHSRILKTVNGGQSWDTVYSGGTGWLSFFYFPDRNNGYATVSNSTILKTTDGGNSWNTLSSLGGDLWMSGNYFSNKDLGFVGGGDFATGGGKIFKTSDGGNSWQTVSTEFGTSLMYFTNAQTGFAIAGKMGWNTKRLIRSDDGGATWKLENAPKDKINGMAFPDENTGYAVGDSGRILKYTKATGLNGLFSHGQAVNIYPNPVSDYLFLKTESPLTDCNIIIYDLCGRVYSITCKLSGSPVKLDVSALNDGIYLLVVSKNSELLFHKTILIIRE